MYSFKHVLGPLLCVGCSLVHACDFSVSVDPLSGAPQRVDGATLNAGGPVPPGATVCIQADVYDRDKLEFINFIGTPAQPIKIVNVGGQVLVQHARVYLDDSQFVELAGDGVAGIDYGFRIVAPAEQAFGMKQRSAAAPPLRGLRAHHIEIHYADRFGVQAVGVRGFEGSAEPEAIEDIELHHILIHRGVDAHGNALGGFREGFYIGSSFYGSAAVPLIRGVRIHHNTVQGAGWDGIQVGSASAGCEIDHNVVIDDSRYLLRDQNSGIMIAKGSACSVHHNRILGGQGPGIYHQGLGDQARNPAAPSGGLIYANLIVPSTAPLTAEPDPSNSMPDIATDDRRVGIWVAHARDGANADRPGNMYVWHNTVITDTQPGVVVATDPTRIAGYQISNNLVSGNAAAIHPSSGPAIVANRVAPTADLQFAPDTELLGAPARQHLAYRLSEQSDLARDQADPTTAARVQRDLRGKRYGADGAADIGADEYDPGQGFWDGFEGR
ncbi:right-handed parallel beta-helix repeat-containing protein [Pseudomarimonas arenosa]|uniref:Right-handed parallel beta-helix repeat-containing protein n=1 Tax=Pseudomarimonas arenosa TaxID=2774145 RepID=A0AAW3ZLQ4_9GAMM|nr:right-handed parallel beta-helix repeat-containing protein [Pseudomarimonas arenosa]MBD8527073.1 right-handed parallel beta-helix repeat-containing protein [Pseudomarimonas arenosa]